MRKRILSAVLLTATLATFQSCRKEIQRAPESVEGGNFSQKSSICNLSAISTTSYYSLAASLCGSGTGKGTVGALDTKLNCVQSAGDPCYPVSGEMVQVTILSASQWDVLSDGVMTVAEQETLINQIKSACNMHVLSAHGFGYVVNHYDVWYGFPLCGTCSPSITIFVDYKASKPCRS